MAALTPKLLGAAKDDDAATISQLISQGVDPNAANGIGQTALHVASLWGNISVASVLLDAGASVSAVNQFGATPLHFAAQNNRMEVARLLVLRGADVHKQAANGKLPYEMASSADLRILLGGPSNRMHQAVLGLELDELRRLLNEGGDLAEPDSKGQTPLHLAAVAALTAAEGEAQGGMARDGEGGMAPLKVILAAAEARGATAVRVACDAVDAEGLSALHRLVQGAHVPGAALLLRAGADANARSRASGAYRSGQWARQTAEGKQTLESDDRPALHMAVDCAAPSEPLIALLLEHQADPNARDVEKRTALHVALDDEAEHGQNLRVAEALLRSGADPSLGNNEMGMASSCVAHAAARNDAAVLQLLLRHAAPHSEPGKGGFTPLALAARAGAAPCVALLLAAGADPDAPTPAGKSARELATINKRTAVLAAFAAHAAGPP